MGTFKDSLKKWFYTNSSSAASTDARIPLLTSTGEPKGSDTMKNLASVLGGFCGYKIFETDEPIDWDDLGTGLFYIASNTSNPHEAFSDSRSMVLSFIPNPGKGFQIALNANSPIMKIRTHGGGGRFSEWKSITFA